MSCIKLSSIIGRYAKVEMKDGEQYIGVIGNIDDGDITIENNYKTPDEIGTIVSFLEKEEINTVSLLVNSAEIPWDKFDEKLVKVEWL